MVLDRLENADLYASLHPQFAAAFKFLREAEAAKLPPGRIELDGARLYVNVAHLTGSGRAGTALEAHRKYIDIQYVFEGADEIGWKPTAECKQVTSAYDAKADAACFSDTCESWVTVPAGTFVIFFPEDGHAPSGAAKGLGMKKLIAKVLVEA
jgi:YhcH/YjgK/YiaL family protein